ncbi:tyrosine--tRNA ligase, mitochondrial isoform X2 [Phymastichus coffea]|uniref:tyrosine--tRNA ligase, mitochondrial isoform X2 n=1 Tax=Phymastichus coffea TaxID=108790 RepID=UPI00273C4B55|nr:tyrosine--tRNA ligase, mitochondrial isoform X2 [Phymastichus coffea]
MLRKCCSRIFQTNDIHRFYSEEPKNKYRNILKLHERGMYQDLFPDDSANNVSIILNRSPQCVYAGFDPTADSLHVGNLLVLMNLLHWQRGGHQVIALVGGATGLIGDPSHRTSERIAMDDIVLKRNIESIKQNIITIFDNHAKYFWQNNPYPLKPIMIVNNIDWYKDVKVLDFIKNIGIHFRMGTMLIKTSVQSRLESKTGMSFAEFTYQILQAYDWLCLLKNYGCCFQIGGSDQLGNIAAGHELISRTEKNRVFGFTLPLITAEGGKKFGKSLNNAVWLSHHKSSSFEMYQYFIRTADADVENYLKLFTFLPLKQITYIMKEHEKEPDLRKAQQILAEHVTLLVHGEEGLLAAQNATLLLYDKSIESLSTMTQDQIALAFEGAHIVDLVPNGEMTVFDLAMKANCFKTERDAVRIIKAGGLYINYERVTDLETVIKQRVHILPNNVTLIRTGKRNYHLVRWMTLRRVEELK